MPAVHAAGNRALTDVFVIDLATKFSGDPSAYAPCYEEQDLDILKTDRPDLVPRWLER